MKETSGSIRKTLASALGAYAALLSLRVVCEIAEGLETGNLLTDTVSRFSNSFTHDGLADLILFGALFLLLRKTAGREARPDGRTLALAVFLAALSLVGMCCREMGKLAFLYADSYQLCLSLLCLLGRTLLFYPLLRLGEAAMDRPFSAGSRQLRRPVLIGTLVIFLCWLPWLLCNYPASFCPDATHQLSQWAGFTPWTAHHPPLSTLLMGLCCSLGRAVGSVNFGCFLYVLLQSVCGALVFSYSIGLLYREGLPFRLWLLMLLFFAATPFWGSFAQWFEKDLVYAECFTLTLSLALPVLRDRRCSAGAALRLGGAAFLSLLLRKTGLYELCPALLLLALTLRGRDRRNLLAAVCAVVLLAVGTERALYPALGIEAGSAREALSIPFQQTARYVCTYPDEVTEEERLAIDAVLDYEKLGAYNPIISDPVKATYREDASALGPYFAVWLRMLFKHPLCYFEAGFMNSYGYYTTDYVALDAYLLTQYDPLLGEMGIHRVFGDFPTRFFDSLRQCMIEFPAIQLLCTAGLYTWVLLFCLLRLGKCGKRAEMLLLLPSFMNVLVCIASPLTGSTRYALPMIAVTPMLLGWTLLQTRRTR